MPFRFAFRQELSSATFDALRYLDAVIDAVFIADVGTLSSSAKQLRGDRTGHAHTSSRNMQQDVGVEQPVCEL